MLPRGLGAGLGPPRPGAGTLPPAWGPISLLNSVLTSRWCPHCPAPQALSLTLLQHTYSRGSLQAQCLAVTAAQDRTPILSVPG